MSTSEEIHGRQDRIIRLRIAGETLQAIADREGITKQAVAKTLQRALARPKSETAELALALDLERIDFLLRLYWPSEKALPEGVAFPQLMELLEKRAKIWGYYSPEKHEVRHQEYVLDWGDERNNENENPDADAA